MMIRYCTLSDKKESVLKCTIQASQHMLTLMSP